MVALFPAFSLPFPTVEVVSEPDPQKIKKEGLVKRGRVEVSTLQKVGNFINC